ncbi:VPLPA-CTERM protein sorting domain-containing protein [Albimonas donghaensis]|uniref:VPLPA-CTERM protein sorting domain-containing protein n=1 Tax=Albimonas donghaensis TaxID=356660 RepID=A0A1H2T2Y2_9RHOB|nr:VPLPA-CTERM sorting domain-containing protein [Albimonas donghaensis]SDW38218.1 VPLPA-CTERM protein sorting domain-containing protein [Albimonas donghaensis]
MKFLLGAVVAVAALPVTQAVALTATPVDLTIHRQSDTTALVVGTGTTDYAGGALRLIDVILGGDGYENTYSWDFPANDFTLGGASINYASSGAPDSGYNDYYFDFYSDDGFDIGDPVEGSVLVTLESGVFAAVGASGLVEGGADVEIGGWSVVEGATVPLPAAGLLLIGGLGVLGFAGRRRAIRACLLPQPADAPPLEAG